MMRAMFLYDLFRPGSHMFWYDIIGANFMQNEAIFL